MGRVVTVVFLLVASALAANIKLYLKDGTNHMVREYSVQSDRVRFYSLERSQWEEIPLDLVDIKRTESEEAEKKAVLAEETQALKEEDRAARELQEEAMRIPMDPGVYYIVGKEAKPIKQAEPKVQSDKKRSVLKALSPIPMVSGKATLEVDQERSPTVFDNPLQEFYIQLSDPQRFGIVKLTGKKGARVVENVTIIPVSNEMIEEPIEVQVFRKQITRDGLYKIWPAKPLEAGEYAVVEYTSGKLNMQVWDFAYRPASK